MASIIDELEAIKTNRGGSGNRFSKPKAETAAKPKIFQSPFVDVGLLRDYLNGDGNNIEKLADDRYLSPGQVMEKINSTARAIVSFLNEDVDTLLLYDIYKHKNYFLKSIIQYTEKKNFFNPHNFEQNILIYFDTLNASQQALLIETLTDKFSGSFE